MSRLRNQPGGRMLDDYLRAKVFRDGTTPGDWWVECEVENGAIEVTIFSGPNARERASRYADHHCLDFEEIGTLSS